MVVLCGVFVVSVSAYGAYGFGEDRCYEADQPSFEGDQPGE